MLRSRHSKRHEHTGENEPPKRKKKGARYVEHSQLLPFEENSFTSSNAFSKDKSYKRLWINSLEKDVIRSGFQNVRPGMDYYSYYQEAQTRQVADWLIGMNASPLYTLNLQQKGVQGTFSLGRVQTPTLYMIYQRQEAIEKFIKEPFFEVEANIKVKQGSFKGVLSPTQRFKTQEELLAFVSSKQAKIGNQEGRIADVQTKEKKRIVRVCFL